MQLRTSNGYLLTLEGSPPEDGSAGQDPSATPSHHTSAARSWTARACGWVRQGHSDGEWDRGIGLGLNLLEQALPGAVSRPSPVSFIDRLPRAEPLG